jgi:putative colanic acid biosynthesis acetyltransferase WcaF
VLSAPVRARRRSTDKKRSRCRGVHDTSASAMMDLSTYDNSDFDRGASRWKEALWILVRWIFFQNAFPWPSALRVELLKAFGARMGNGVVIRTNVNISFPWRLAIGNQVWIGEDVGILSLAPVTIGSNVCLSQRAYLCAGSHDHRREDFPLITRPITIHDGSWVAAMAFIGPGVEIGVGSVIAAGAVVVRSVPAGACVRGNPAKVEEKAETLKN